MTAAAGPRSHYPRDMIVRGGSQLPEDTFAEDRVTHGKSPNQDPAQQRLIEQEVVSQQNPIKQPPSNLTTIDQDEPPHGRAWREQITDLATREGDSFQS